MQDVVLTF